MAIVPPGENHCSDSLERHSQNRDHGRYGSIWRTDSETTRRRYFLVSGGLIVFSLLAALAQLISNQSSGGDSLSQTTDLWAISGKITSEDLKRAIKAELSSSFRKQTQNLETALSTQYPAESYLHSSSHDQR